MSLLFFQKQPIIPKKLQHINSSKYINACVSIAAAVLMAYVHKVSQGCCQTIYGRWEMASLRALCTQHFPNKVKST